MHPTTPKACLETELIETSLSILDSKEKFSEKLAKKLKFSIALGISTLFAKVIGLPVSLDSYFAKILDLFFIK